MNTEELVAMKSELKEGTMQRRVQYFSYQTLRRIYYQRKDHRLPHWHKFCGLSRCRVDTMLRVILTWIVLNLSSTPLHDAMLA